MCVGTAAVKQSFIGSHGDSLLQNKQTNTNTEINKKKTSSVCPSMSDCEGKRPCACLSDFPHSCPVFRVNEVPIVLEHINLVALGFFLE